MPYILAEGAKMIAMAVISTLSAIVVGYIACRVAAKISMRIRKDVFERVSRFSSFEFNAFSTASLITRSTNDVQQIQMFTAILLRMVLLAPMMGVGALIMAYRKSPGLSWTVFLGVVLLLGLILVLMLTAMPKLDVYKRQGRVSGL